VVKSIYPMWGRTTNEELHLTTAVEGTLANRGKRIYQFAHSDVGVVYVFHQPRGFTGQDRHPCLILPPKKRL